MNDQTTPLPVRTHLGLHHGLCGAPVALGPGAATVRLQATPEMAADAEGLVHGGFVFGAADHAAMLAVNDPLVVLAAAEVRFLAPLAVGEVVELRATVTEERGRKRIVAVEGRQGGAEGPVVFTGSFTAAVLDQHVLRTAR